jgi:putative tryptophan/tyrosine transport system substrate-binding protein
MRRRKFIMFLGGAAVAPAMLWPLAARAQPAERMRRIGVLLNLAPDDPETAGRITAFAQGLAELGWTAGRNVRIDYRWGIGDAERYRRSAKELVALGADVILASSSLAVTALQSESRAVPIVFVQVTDPVGAGYVASMARPGGNITGFTNFEYRMSAKWLELLKEIAPRVTRAAVLRDPAVAVGIGQLGAMQSVAPSLGVELRPVDTRDAGEIEGAITALARRRGRMRWKQ